MLKDITLGQYFPGESFVHRLDPRLKIMLSLIYIVVIFLVQSFWGYGLILLFTGLVVSTSKVPVSYMLRGLKPIMFFIILTALLNLFMTKSGDVLVSWWILAITDEGLYLAAFMVLRLMFLIIGSSILTLTTSPISLTDGIERLLSPYKRIGIPAHELAMMMTIALRFIPTLLEETDKIMKAQAARGADFESGNVIKRAKALIPILIPLFVSAFRRADELATAMECRCYKGGEGRTRLKQLKYTRIDAYATLLMIVFTAGIVLINMTL